MTIHWKALEEQYLKVPYIAAIFGGNPFSEFFSKELSSIFEKKLFFQYTCKNISNKPFGIDWSH
jgi:hypothetical protein